MQVFLSFHLLLLLLLLMLLLWCVCCYNRLNTSRRHGSCFSERYRKILQKNPKSDRTENRNARGGEKIENERERERKKKTIDC